MPNCCSDLTWREVVQILKSRQTVVVLSCCVMAASLGPYYVTGNLVPYVASYMRMHVNNATSSSDFTWLNGLANLGYGVMIPFSGCLKDLIGYRCSLGIGIILQGACVGASYSTVQNNVQWFILTFGFMPWVGTGLIYGLILDMVVQWVPNHGPSISGVVLSFISIFGVVYSLITTALINPGDIQPNLLVDHERFFTDEEMLGRVPHYFWQISLISLVLQLVSLPFMLTPPTVVTITEPAKSSTDESTPDNGVENGSKSGASSVPTETTRLTDEPRPAASTEDQLAQLDYRQMLRGKEFYLIWITYAAVMVPANFFLTNNKAYGLTFWDGDASLSNLISYAVVLSCLGKIAWSVAIGRISYRVIAWTYNVMFAVSVQALVAAQFIDDQPLVYYGVFVCVASFCIGGTFALLPGVAVAAYGKDHFATNFGILYTSQALGSVFGAFVNQILVDELHWLWSFTVTSSFTLLGIVATIFMPSNLKGLRKLQTEVSETAAAGEGTSGYQQSSAAGETPSYKTLLSQEGQQS